MTKGNAARVSATSIRDDLANIVNRVAFGGERIVLERRGKDVVAIVPLDDLQRLEELEGGYWEQEAAKALAEAKRLGERPLSFAKLERRMDAAKRTASKRTRSAR